MIADEHERVIVLERYTRRPGGGIEHETLIPLEYVTPDLELKAGITVEVPADTIRYLRRLAGIDEGGSP